MAQERDQLVEAHRAAHRRTRAPAAADGAAADGIAIDDAPTARRGQHAVRPADGGKERRERCVVANDEGEILVGVAESELFSMHEMGLKPDSRRYAQEIASLIRYFSREAKITLATNHKDRADFIDILAAELGCAPALFAVVPARPNATNGLHVYAQ